MESNDKSIADGQTGSSTPGQPRKRITAFWMDIIVFGVLLVLGLTGYYLHLKHEAQLAEQRAQDVLRKAKEKQQAEEKKKHDLVFERIREIKEKGVALPVCPLVYPLLDEKGLVTPLGSFISYLSMKSATYLPQEVFLLPNPGMSFHRFGLFDVQRSDHGTYLAQLPLFQGTQETAAGTLTRTKKGYRIQLKFTAPQKKPKKFDKTFPVGRLQLAPAWIASCIHSWAGYRATDGDKAYMERPIFADEKDLLRASRLEWMFREQGGQFVDRYDEILGRNPGEPILVDHCANVLHSRSKGWNHAELNGLYGPSLEKSPNSAFLSGSFAYQLALAQDYDRSLERAFDLLLKDDNNRDFYWMARNDLEHKGYYEEAKELLKTWTEKHPENVDSWIEYAYFMIGYAWVARGTDYAYTISKENLKIFKDRVQEGLASALKASELAPGNAKVWDLLLIYGNGASFDASKMKEYLGKAMACDPFDVEACKNYMAYLQPQWFGSDEELMAFARSQQKWYPEGYCLAFAWLHTYAGNSDKEWAEWNAAFDGWVKNDPTDWKNLMDCFKAHLLRHPADSEVWGDYFGWMAFEGAGKVALDLAKEIAAADPELAALAPYMTIEYWNSINEHLRIEHPSEECIKDIMAADQVLLDLDPHNWNILNRRARFASMHGLPEVARMSFDAIGDHWDGSVWERKDFEEAKRVVSSTPFPTPVKP